LTARARRLLTAPGDFRRLAVATGVSVIGTYSAAMALAVRTFGDTHNPAWVSAVFAAEFLPPIAIGVLFAELLDRVPPRYALVASDLTNALVFTALVAVREPALVVGLALVSGAASGVFRPLSLAVVPAVVGDDRIDAANGVLTAVDTAATAAGQVGAGAVIALASANLVLGANAVSFVLSAALLASCRSLAGRGAQARRLGTTRRLRRTARTIRRSPGLRQIFVSWMPVVAVTGIVNSIEVPLLLGPLNAGAAATGVTLAAASAGQAAGGLIGARRGGSRAGYPAALAVIAVAYLGAGISPTVAIVFVLFAVGGVANGLALVHVRSVLQRSTAAAERTGIIALLQAVGGVMVAVGAAAGGAIATASSPRAAMATGAAVTAVGAVAARLAVRGGADAV
jgi:MFS family permease